MSFVLRVAISGVAIWVATLVLPGLTVTGASTPEGQVWVYLLVGLIFGIVNAVVKPLVQLVSIPLYVLTLGLFTLVVNGLMLMVTAWVTSATHWGLRIDTFGTAVLAALIVSVVSFALSAMIPASRRRDD